MNKELLNKVADHIEAHPEQFGMSEWDCGTTACIAGHIVRMSDCFIGTIELRAKTAADLSYGEVHRLFFAANWPDEYQDAHSEARDDADEDGAARIAAARIRHFVATNGAE